MKNLMIARCGSKSLHASWLTGPDRNWDLFLCPYEPIEFGGLEGITIPGQKWSGLFKLLATNPFWRSYDFICFPDDDLFAATEVWNGLFDWCARLNAKLAQPALTPESFYSHFITLKNYDFDARATTFVEIMAPCFSRQFLEDALPMMAWSRSGTGFGFDVLLPYLLQYKNIWIIDAAPVYHTRPVGVRRQNDLSDLSVYDLRFCLNFGIPLLTDTVAGYLKGEGRLAEKGSSAFSDAIRGGWSYLKDKNLRDWDEVLDRLNRQDETGDNRPLIDGRINQALKLFGKSDHVVSRNKPSLVSSVSQWSWSAKPSLEASGGNDGLVNGCCGFHTSFEKCPWWQVDLLGPHRIVSIAVYNRLDQSARCTDFDLMISSDGQEWSSIYSKRDGREFGGVDGNELRVNFKRDITARFVRLQSVQETFLHLDQIEVYGFELDD